MTALDEIAMMWARKRADELQRRIDEAELRSIVSDMRAAQRECAPFIARSIADRQARMRQDGPTGFVMVLP